MRPTSANIKCSTDMIDRDGKTPEELSKQILAIAPILPGQNNDTFTQSPQPPSLDNKSLPSRPAPGHRPQDSGNSSNLIDFGSNEPAKIQQQTQPQSQPQVASKAPPRGFSMEPLQPTVVRSDSVDGEIDQFVDAES